MSGILRITSTRFLLFNKSLIEESNPVVWALILRKGTCTHVQGILTSRCSLVCNVEIFLACRFPGVFYSPTHWLTHSAPPLPVILAHQQPPRGTSDEWTSTSAFLLLEQKSIVLLVIRDTTTTFWAFVDGRGRRPWQFEIWTSYEIVHCLT